MNTVRFIKSFSKGQITIPKDVRTAIGLGEDFWLRVSVYQGKIIAEPVEGEQINKNYPQNLLSIKGNWFSRDEWRSTRSEVEIKLKKLHGQSSP